MAANRNISSFGVGTQLTMIGRNPDEQSGFVNPPLYKGSTIIHKTLDEIELRSKRFFYGTAGSPTIANLEEAWTHLTGAAGTVLSPSGLGSVAMELRSKEAGEASDYLLRPSILNSTFDYWSRQTKLAL